MRYRTQDANGDYVMGIGTGEILYNVPEAVAQAVKTRLLLMTPEWFLDQNEGTPYEPDILGAGTGATYDAVIQERILDTQGVVNIVEYDSNVNTVTRALTVTALINTVYGQTPIVVTF